MDSQAELAKTLQKMLKKFGNPQENQSGKTFFVSTRTPMNNDVRVVLSKIYGVKSIINITGPNPRRGPDQPDRAYFVLFGPRIK
jgi:adenylyl- and sulfurtransferase ThiI